MNKATLQKIAKKNKINLAHYDEVHGFINEAYTYIFISFACRENIGGIGTHLNRFDIKMSVAAALKRDEFPEDYTTQGWQWLSEIKA